MSCARRLSTDFVERHAIRDGFTCGGTICLRVSEQPGRSPDHAKVVTGGHLVGERGYCLAPTVPHGGFKHSGYGKDLSMYGFADYTRVKHVMSYFGG